MLKVLCAFVVVGLLTGCASVNEGHMGFVCERVFRDEQTTLPKTTDTELARQLTVPTSRLKCNTKKLFWFRVRFN